MGLSELRSDALEAVPTPKSRPDGPPKVAVFGAGIAGLTAAHELAERGFEVWIYEPTKDARFEADKKAGAKAVKAAKAAKAARAAKASTDVLLRIGGMAATQYLTAPWLTGERLRPFPKPDGTTDSTRNKPPKATGEHGFRFFPAYYLHIWDMLQRIPIRDESGNVTSRTVYDNVQRVITQAVTALDGGPSLVMPREAPRSIAEMAGAFDQIRQLGFTATDVSTFLGRITRYLVTSPERRAQEFEDVSAYEFFVGIEPGSDRHRYQYSEAFERQILDMPKILAAFDSRYGDARTNITTYVQLNMALDRYDSKADGVLNGPTTEAWFDHWYRHLEALGVHFAYEALQCFTFEGGTLKAWTVAGDALADPRDLDPNKDFDAKPPKGAKELKNFDYYVVATDGFQAELATRPLRKHDDYAKALAVKSAATDVEIKHALRTISTVVGLDGWATSKPSAQGPRHPVREPGLRNPMRFEEMGKRDWDRFQTLAGIQFFFDTELQIVRGHIYFSNSPWGLSAICQSGFWADKPNLETNRYATVMSVDIGDWNTPSSKGQAARSSTLDDIAREVWKQITDELMDSFGEDVVMKQVPLPVWYALDEFIIVDADEKPLYNRAPYLVPIVGDWKNRPGADPWNPHGSSSTELPNDVMRELQEKDLHVWQAKHGGYQVHHDKLVFAGTWCKTFTRMTSMEAACESGRHAVNAILDHYVYDEAEKMGTPDPRDLPGLSWRMPFGFVDQELSSPIRQPTPAGDFCFVFDCENREPADARPMRKLDSDYYHAGLAHPWRVWGVDNASAIASNLGGYGQTVDPSAPTLWIVDQLRQWRTLVETAYGTPDVQTQSATVAAAAASRSGSASPTPTPTPTPETSESDDPYRHVAVVRLAPVEGPGWTFHPADTIANKSNRFSVLDQDLTRASRRNPADRRGGYFVRRNRRNQ